MITLIIKSSYVSPRDRSERQDIERNEHDCYGEEEPVGRIAEDHSCCVSYEAEPLGNTDGKVILEEMEVPCVRYFDKEN